MVRKPISAYANHESHGPNPADIGIEDHSSAQDHNDVADQKATKRDADIDIGFRPFTDISVKDQVRDQMIHRYDMYLEASISETSIH